MKSKMLLGGAAALTALAMAAKDPIVMSVNGEDVTRSEFEYLFNKNSQQQIDPQPLDKYVEMFSIYKMKVADAKAHGLDTLPSYLKEIKQYSEELSTPFFTDSVYLNKLTDETLNRMELEAEAQHIMLFKNPGVSDSSVRAQADSIRRELLKGADFADMAARYSKDRGSNSRGGSMGYIVAGRLPYSFEKAVFETPEGKYSDVIETEGGYHVIKGGKKIAARGSVTVAHILKLVPATSTPEQTDSLKAQIDSISSVLKSDPQSFERLAREYSDDKGTASKGGMLRPFISGQMVPEFNEAAFALEDGEISEPIRTSYGWHIIHRISSSPFPAREIMRPSVMQAFTTPGNDRSALMEDHKYAGFEKKLHAKRNGKLISQMEKDVAVLGLDSVFVEKYSSPSYSGQTLFTINKKQYPLSELIPRLKRFHYTPGAVADSRLASTIETFYRKCLEEQALAQLETDEPEFHNLMNEYRDGSLLYEMSVKRVWDKASKDKEGLADYFERHRSDFVWNEPHVKGYLIQASNDSVANEIRVRLQQLDENDYVNTIRKEFKDQATIDKILMTEGQNGMVDNLVFGKPAVTPSNASYTTYFLYDMKVLQAPESVDDVKVMATNAYQNELENDWIDELKAKYPVVLNEKEINKLDK